MTKARPTAPKDDLTNQLLAQFKSLIANGVLKPGARLPPERELAMRFGVSRPSLRHVLKVLETIGVVTQRAGDGTYLTSSNSGVLTEPLDFLIRLDSISLFDLLETRLIVEPELAARAAERVTSADLAALQATLDGISKERDRKRQNDYDLSFHETIFRISGNRLCQRLFALIHRMMTSSMLLTSQLVDWEHTLSFHRPIYQAIYRRDPEEARRRMTAHPLDARELLAHAVSKVDKLNIEEEIRPVARGLRRKSVKRPDAQFAKPGGTSN